MPNVALIFRSFLTATGSDRPDIPLQVYEQVVLHNDAKEIMTKKIFDHI